MCGQQVIKQNNTSHQHIIIKHIDNIYKWKIIREKTTYYYCCDAKASSNSLSPLFFCRHQPTGGSNLSQLQLTTIKLQLDREAPTSSIYQTESLLIYLRYQLCSVASPSVLLFLIFSVLLFYILPSLDLLSPALKKTLSAYQDDIIYRFPHMTVCILLGIRNGKSCLFAFCLLTPFISLLRNYNCRCQF